MEGASARPRARRPIRTPGVASAGPGHPWAPWLWFLWPEPKEPARSQWITRKWIAWERGTPASEGSFWRPIHRRALRFPHLCRHHFAPTSEAHAHPSKRAMPRPRASIQKGCGRTVPRPRPTPLAAAPPPSPVATHPLPAAPPAWNARCTASRRSSSPRPCGDSGLRSAHRAGSRSCPEC